MKSLITLAAALLTTTLSFASPVSYSYASNTYTHIDNGSLPAGATFNTTQSVSGSLTFSGPLVDMAFGAIAPVAFSFSNGFHTFTNLDALVLVKINLEVISGVITAWDIQFNDQFLYQNDPLGKQENVLVSTNHAGTQEDSGALLEMVTATGYSFDQGYVLDAPGTWVSVNTTGNAVPEPGSLGLSGAALVGAALLRRRRTA